MGYIYVWEHSGGGRHIDADWKPPGCRGSACVEVMTTLHGSAPSLRRRAEGCDHGGPRQEIDIDRVGFVVRDETPRDSPPHLPPPLGSAMPQPQDICYMVILRQLRLFGSSSTWDDLDSIPVASPPAKFRMPDIERYMVYCDEGPWVRRVTDDHYVSFISEWCSPALVHIFGVLARQDMG
ncbi:hypothetical protein AAG906_002929 [Vitis piasezkii]